MADVLTIPASEFKARCLALFDQLSSGKLETIIITKRGKPVGELKAPRPVERPKLYGALKGMFGPMPSDEELMAPAFDELWDAEKEGPIGGME